MKIIKYFFEFLVVISLFFVEMVSLPKTLSFELVVLTAPLPVNLHNKSNLTQPSLPQAKLSVLVKNRINAPSIIGANFLIKQIYELFEVKYRAV